MPRTTLLPSGRARRVAAMTLDVTGGYAGYLLQRVLRGEQGSGARRRAAHARAAKRVREELQTLRGPLMTLGQTLSLHTDRLPEELIAELTKLQMEAPAMHPSLARAQFKRSLGAYPEDVFRSFEPEPFAAASLGQVHRAVSVRGQQLAVKIQYPGIREAAAHDFKWLRGLSLVAKASGHVPKAVLDEIETQILAETDYTREAANIEHFRPCERDLPFLSLPRVLREHSTDQVLTMSLVTGQHLDALLRTRPSQSTRDRLGAHLVEAFYYQFMRLGALHADPNWGNYLFREDATFGLVDFGCVKYFKRPFVDSLMKLYLYPGRRDTPEFRRLLEDGYTVAGGRMPAATRRVLIDWSNRFYRKVYPPEPENTDRLFDFGDASFLHDYLQEAAALLRSKGLLPEYIFLSRAEMGLYNTLYRLKARVPTSAIVRKYLAMSPIP